MHADHIDTAHPPIGAPQDAGILNNAAQGLDLRERLALARDTVSGRMVFTTSFGLEDQLITDALFMNRIDVQMVTIDTGRLFPETYAVWAATERRYGRRITAIMPNSDATTRMVGEIGIDGFYNSLANRHACCGVRKVAPLACVLDGAAGWITGLRGEQSAQREGVMFAAPDPARRLLKFNPLFDWSRAYLLDALERREIPINILHKQGFASIGCAPCTRAIAPGEPERAGRWWWEADQARECGLHLGPNGRLSSTRQAAAQ